VKQMLELRDMKEVLGRKGLEVELLRQENNMFLVDKGGLIGERDKVREASRDFSRRLMGGRTRMANCEKRSRKTTPRSRASKARYSATMNIYTELRGRGKTCVTSYIRWKGRIPSWSEMTRVSNGELMRHPLSSVPIWTMSRNSLRND
jgi:hypothetical protein